MQNQEQIRFKTAAGWLGYHSGMPEPNDPGMTVKEHAKWQEEVFLDALTPEDDFLCVESDEGERCKVQCPYCERI